jgi:hypothetical protein
LQELNAFVKVKPYCFKKETKLQEKLQGAQPSRKWSHIVSKKKQYPKNCKGLCLHKSEAISFQKRNKTPKIARGSVFVESHMISKRNKIPKNASGSFFAERLSHIVLKRKKNPQHASGPAFAKTTKMPRRSNSVWKCSLIVPERYRTQTTQSVSAFAESEASFPQNHKRLNLYKN